ncbi:MAG TPA: hypothetical protein VN661_00735 [Candidatus Acidoferrales bacterium]|nr:hypothetical protein [Candidatus Acidoferrales bacterium]
MRRQSAFGFTAIGAILALFTGGCAVSKKIVRHPGHPPAPLLSATKQQLVTQYNRQAGAITSINAAVSLKLTAGSEYTGVIKQYHEVNGFILAQKPSSIRVIGQAPVVGTNIFDMVSDGQTFHIFIPSKSEFIVGPANLDRRSNQPIENLRPQHLVDAIFWTPIAPGAPVLFESTDARSVGHYYVLTLIHAGEPAAPGGEAAAGADQSTNWQIERKVWFDRQNLSVSRVEIYDAEGSVASDVHYSGWSAFGATTYPRQITLERPANDYQLQIGINRLTVDAPIPADKFVMKQPPGSKLVQANGATMEPHP